MSFLWIENPFAHVLTNADMLIQLRHPESMSDYMIRSGGPVMFPIKCAIKSFQAGYRLGILGG